MNSLYTFGKRVGYLGLGLNLEIGKPEATREKSIAGGNPEALHSTLQPLYREPPENACVVPPTKPLNASDSAEVVQGTFPSLLAVSHSLEEVLKLRDPCAKALLWVAGVGSSALGLFGRFRGAGGSLFLRAVA